MLIRIAIFLLAAAGLASAELRQMTLKQAVQTALDRNPDVALARLDQQAAELEVKIVRDPFQPHAVAGSGLAYSSGFPLSIEGSAPSILQVRVLQSLVNRPLSYRSGQAREAVNGARITLAAKQQEVAFRTAVLGMDAEHAQRVERLAAEQIDRLTRVSAMVTARVDEGLALPIEAKRASVDLTRARHRLRVAQENRRYLENSLAVVLGLEPSDRVAIGEDSARIPPALVPVEEEAIRSALEGSLEMQRLRSATIAKEFEARSHRAAWLPKVDLVAQYALLGRFNNYEEFFNRFQRNNVQLGASFQMSLLPSSGERAAAAKADVEANRLRTEMNALRSRIVLDTKRSWQLVEEADSAMAVARQDLDLARDEVTLLMARMEEGRASVRELEAARLAENQKWIEFYGAAMHLEKARLTVLRLAGGLVAALTQ